MLAHGECVVVSLLADQLVMAPLLYDDSVANDGDLVGVLDGVEALRDNN